jgi:hypothetical protein
MTRDERSPSGTWVRVDMDWSTTRAHALLLAGSRNLGSATGRDCTLSAYYRSESKTNASDVEPWLLVATVSFVCNAHPFANTFRWVGRHRFTHKQASMHTCTCKAACPPRG